MLINRAKRIFIACILILFSLSTEVFSEDLPEEENKNYSITLGVLNGGGALVGFEFEAMLFNRFSFQFGGGYIGAGASLNFHFRTTVNSHFIALAYWYQNIGLPQIHQQVIGTNFGFRAWGFLTGQIGVGYVISRGAGISQYLEDLTGVKPPPVMLLYNLGVYFDF